MKLCCHKFGGPCTYKDQNCRATEYLRNTDKNNVCETIIFILYEANSYSMRYKIVSCNHFFSKTSSFHSFKC